MCSSPCGDSINEPAQEDNVIDSTNVQPKEAVGSTFETKDDTTNAPSSAPPSLSPSPPTSPTPLARPLPGPARGPMRVRSSGLHMAPRPPIPYGPFLMSAGLIPPFNNQPLMMPPPPQFQFAPYGQPYSYPMIPPNPWATGPFDCFSDTKNCCLTFCCPCVTFGQIAEILNEGQTPSWEHAAVYLMLDSFTFSVGTFLCVWPYRVKMRTKYWLRGKLLWDFIFTFFCTRASLCQQYRQLSLVGFDVPMGWEANREKMRLKALENTYQMQNRQVTPPTVEQGMYR